MHMFKIVLFAMRKPQEGINYEIVLKAKIRSKLVPTVLYAPMPHRSQADFSCHGNRAKIKPPSNQAPTKFTHHTYIHTYTGEFLSVYF
jgi:hypothetical protein